MPYWHFSLLQNALSQKALSFQSSSARNLSKSIKQPSNLIRGALNGSLRMDTVDILQHNKDLHVRCKGRRVPGAETLSWIVDLTIESTRSKRASYIMFYYKLKGGESREETFQQIDGLPHYVVSKLTKNHSSNSPHTKRCSPTFISKNILAAQESVANLKAQFDSRLRMILLWSSDSTQWIVCCDLPFSQAKLMCMSFHLNYVEHAV